MIIYLSNCLFHFVIGILLFTSVEGIEKIIKKLFKKKTNIYYSTTITLYVVISYFFLLFEKNYFFLFTLLSSIFYFLNIKKMKVNSNLILLLVTLFCFSLIIGQIIHGPSVEYSAWGVFDIYYYVSTIYQENISFFEVNNNNLYNYNYSIFKNILSFLGYQFVFLSFFDGFNFITISLFTFSILKLNQEISKFVDKNFLYNNFFSSILIMFLILSLPYPLYFFETPILLIALPILPQISNFIVKPSINFYKLFYLFFSILISKLALLLILFLALIKNFYKKRIVKLLIFSGILIIFINLILPIKEIYYTFFNFNNFDILKIEKNFTGLHKIFQFILILLTPFFIKNDFRLFFYFPSIILFVFFPAASPAQLFFLTFLIIFTDLISHNKIINFPKINIKIKQIHSISFLGIIFFVIGNYAKIDFYLYFFYFIIFLILFRLVIDKNIKVIYFFLLIITINSLFNLNFRQDNVLNINQKNIYLKIKELTSKNSLIFSDLNSNNQTFSSPWGLYSSISERQFYISSFYGDYSKKININDRKKMFSLNSKIINNNDDPKKYFDKDRFDSFYIVTDINNVSNQNAYLIYKDKDFKILKIK